MKSLYNIFTTIAALITLMMPLACKEDSNDTFRNPIIKDSQSTAFYYHKGLYYYLRNSNGHIMISSMKDPSDFIRKNEKSAINMLEAHSLQHLWCPQLINIDGIWYIYVTADNGDTDNHRMYVLENRNEDPMKGTFTMLGKIRTDMNDNFAMHGHVFEHNDELYIIWSGWKDTRLYAENQCLFIAKMDSPSSLSCERILISEPEYEWELQWINIDGSSNTRYPVYVNECPVYFNNDRTEKIHIFYSASANWTTYHCIGELTAEKDADILDPSSWQKSKMPIFKGSKEKEIYGPDNPQLIPAPNGKDYYLVYAALRNETGLYLTDIHCQPISITDGKPIFGEPVDKSDAIKKISTLR